MCLHDSHSQHQQTSAGLFWSSIALTVRSHAFTAYDRPLTHVQVEDAELQARARALAPLEQLRHEAREAADLNALLLLGEQQAAGGGGSGVLGLQDFLVQGLLRWFKRDFFSWVGGWGVRVKGQRATAPAPAGICYH